MATTRDPNQLSILIKNGIILCFNRNSALTTSIDSIDELGSYYSSDSEKVRLLTDRLQLLIEKTSKKSTHNIVDYLLHIYQQAAHEYPTPKIDYQISQLIKDLALSILYSASVHQLLTDELDQKIVSSLKPIIGDSIATLAHVIPLTIKLAVPAHQSFFNLATAKKKQNLAEQQKQSTCLPCCFL